MAFYRTIRFDAASGNSTGTSTANSLASTHVVDGTNPSCVLVVSVSIAANLANVTGITFGAQNFTLLLRQVNSTFAAQEIWYLIAPTVGTDTITVSLNNVAQFAFTAGSYTGVDQTTPLSSNGGATGSTQNATITKQPNAPDWVLVGVAKRDSTEALTIGTGTERGNRTSGSVTVTANVVGTFGDFGPGDSTDHIVNWTWPTTNRDWALVWGILAAEVLVSGGATSITTDGAAVVANTGTGTAGSLTFSFTTGTGSNKLILVGLSQFLDGGAVTVTWNGLSLTRIAINGGTSTIASLWYRLAPAASTTANVVVTSPTARRMAAWARSYANVAQTGTFRTVKTAMGNSLIASLSCDDSLSTDLVANVLAKTVSTETPAEAGPTEWTDKTTSGTAAQNVWTGGQQTDGSTGVSVTFTWTWPTSSRAWGLVAVPIAAVVSGGSIGPISMHNYRRRRTG
jgi:hypothetical protein